MTESKKIMNIKNFIYCGTDFKIEIKKNSMNTRERNVSNDLPK